MQFGKALGALGIQSVFLPMLGDAYVSALYGGGRRTLEVVHGYLQRTRQIVDAGRCDVIWLEKELFPFLPAAIELWLLRGRMFVLDLDDALFHGYDMSASAFVRWILGRKIDRLMARARVVTVGNGYLEARAEGAGAARVVRLPSVVDLERYPSRTESGAILIGAPLRVVWIGSPATVHYLELVREPLQRVAEQVRLEVLVIGAPAPAWPGVTAFTIPWDVDAEAAQISAGDVGIMPLEDGPWERGKCGYKLIQYMACGLPVVASPVGINAEIVDHGVDGFLASTAKHWEDSIRELAGDAVLRREMGRRGRAKVEQGYCVQAVAPRFAAVLKEAAH